MGDPDAALGVDVRVVRGDQRDSVDLVGEDLDLAGVDVESLDGSGAAVAFETADVGDDDPALGVHVVAVGRAAGVTDPVERAVGQGFGGCRGLVGHPDAAVSGDDDVLGSLDADADLGELVFADWGEWHVFALSRKSLRPRRRLRGLASRARRGGCRRGPELAWHRRPRWGLRLRSWRGYRSWRRRAKCPW